MADIVAKANTVVASEQASACAKLPYFHRQLTEEENVLLNKNKPKKLSDDPDAAGKAVEAGLGGAGAKLSTASAWNAAGAWEERDASKTGIAQMRAALEAQITFRSEPANAEVSTGAATSGFSTFLAPMGVSVTSVHDVSGTASVVHVRGKPRFTYELSLELAYVYNCNVGGGDATMATPGRNSFSGRLKVVDCSNDQDNSDLDLACEWKGGSPPGKAMAVARKALLGPEMRAALRLALTAFEADFQKL